MEPSGARKRSGRGHALTAFPRATRLFGGCPNGEEKRGNRLTPFERRVRQVRFEEGVRSGRAMRGRVLVLLAAMAAAGGGVASGTGSSPAAQVPTGIPDPGGDGDAVATGPDGAREATFDPAPGRPDTRFSEPAPGAVPTLPVGQSWAQSVDLAASNCPDADADSSATEEPRVRAATLCLLNAERTNAGLEPLKENARLRAAAVAHARDMVRQTYFAHESLNGKTFVDRISKARYVTSGYRWSGGENLGWGAKGLATPRLIMRDWMNSDEHRANILKSKYKEVGIGIVLGAPYADKERAATYATEFGARTKIAKKKKKKKKRRRTRRR